MNINSAMRDAQGIFAPATGNALIFSRDFSTPS
jgi:hypothetical protein